MEPFKKTITLLHTPLIGKERAALKDNPKVFNAALRVPGDERKAKATVSDLVTFSGWFRSYVSSSDALGGSSDLLEGVEVPVEVPFDTLEAALDGLYQVPSFADKRTAGSWLWPEGRGSAWSQLSPFVYASQHAGQH